MSKKQQKQTDFFFKKVVKIPIYFGNFIIVFSNNTEKVSRIADCYPGEIDHIYALTLHNFLYQGKESFCVVYNFWDTQPITIGTIMHEVNHAGNRLFSSRGMTKDWDNDEAECYLKGWMADEVEIFMKQCGLV
jgi:hypothetical protein